MNKINICNNLNGFKLKIPIHNQYIIELRSYLFELELR